MNQKDTSETGEARRGEYGILYCKNIHRREYCFNKCNDDINRRLSSFFFPQRGFFLFHLILQSRELAERECNVPPALISPLQLRKRVRCLHNDCRSSIDHLKK